MTAKAWHCGTCGARVRGEQLCPTCHPIAVPDGWPTLRPEARHGIAGEVVSLIDPHTEADPAATLLTFVAAAGNAIGDGPHAVADGARHPARVFVVLAGATSRSRKGSSWQQIRPLFEVADTTWTRSRVMSGFQSGEALIASVSSVATSDTGGTSTPPDPRALVREGEFARLLRVISRQGNVLSPLLRDAWDGVPLQVRTKLTQLSADRSHVSVLAHITIDELRRELVDSEVANGLGNRFLFAAVRRSKLLPSGGALDPDDLRKLGTDLRTVLAKARQLNTLKRSPAAETWWRDWYAETERLEPAGIHGTLTARASAQTLRLSVLYAALDGSPTIGEEHLRAATAVWNYCDASVRHVFGDRTGNPIADRIREALAESNGQGMSRTEIRDMFNRHTPGELIDTAVSTLAAMGAVDVVTMETAGRPRQTIRLCDQSDISARRVGPGGTR